MNADEVAAEAVAEVAAEAGEYLKKIIAIELSELLFDFSCSTIIELIYLIISKKCADLCNNIIFSTH